MSPIRMNSGTAASALVFAVVKMLAANNPKPAGPRNTSTPATLSSRKLTKIGTPTASSSSSKATPADSATHQVMQTVPGEAPPLAATPLGEGNKSLSWPCRKG